MELVEVAYRKKMKEEQITLQKKGQYLQSRKSRKN